MPVQPGHRHVYVSPALRHPAWNAETHLGPSGDFGEQVEDLLKGEVFSTQNVALPYLPPLSGEQVTCRHILDIDDVQPGIHITENAPVQEVHNDLASGRGLVIADPHRRAGIDDDHRQASAHKASRHLLGQELGALIRSDPIG